MKKLCLVALACALLSSVVATAQDLHAHVQQMKSSYASSGSIVVLDDQTILIEPNMPGPLCALPKEENGKTSWSFFAFPLASITLPLSSVDESIISEDRVFTDTDATKNYKPGDVGDTTMVVVVTMPGKQFHTLGYDRDRLAHLGPGPHDKAAYGETADDVEAIGLTFTDHEAARAFVGALRNAVILAKARTIASAQPAPQPSAPR
jgi:hypothetical protein